MSCVLARLPTREPGTRRPAHQSPEGRAGSPLLTFWPLLRSFTDSPPFSTAGALTPTPIHLKVPDHPSPLRRGHRPPTNLLLLVSQFSSVARSCPTLCDPMNRSTPGLPVHHQLPESTQTHVHRVGDAIQPSHPLSSLLLTPILPSIKVFSNESNSSHEVAKVLEFQLQHQPFQWTPRTNGLVGSPCSPRDSQESSPTPHFKSINSLGLSFLHSTTLTSIPDHWKNHSLD